MSRFQRPERRNRNVGTAKQGHGQDNRDTISSRSADLLIFYERLGPYTKVRRQIHGRSFEFVVEETRPDYIHSCTVDDLEYMLKEIPMEDLADLKRIILRQPKRKEEQLQGTWGRLVYSFEFEGDFEPAVIIEAVKLDEKLTKTKKLTPENQKEFDRLIADGFVFEEKRRTMEAPMSLNATRATQLYRTLPHELGHYLDYQEKVIEPLQEKRLQLDAVEHSIDSSEFTPDNPLRADWNTILDQYIYKQTELRDRYFGRPTMEREAYANRCADRISKRLRKLGVIPFDRKLEPESLRSDKLHWSDFSSNPDPRNI